MSPLVKIHVVFERRVCRKQTVRWWIRQRHHFLPVFFRPVFVVAAKFKPLLGHSWCNQGFLQRFAGRKFKILCIRFLIVLVVTLISSCIDLFISDEEMNGCFWQSCLIWNPSWSGGTGCATSFQGRKTKILLVSL